jgi:dUTP pyrophosphatase
MTIPVLGYYRTHKNALAPAMSTGEAACYDLHAHLHGPVVDTETMLEMREVSLYTPENKLIYASTDIHWINDHPRSKVVIPPRHRAIIPTGIIFDIPSGYSVRLHPRSGLSIKQGFIVANCTGVIDSDYFHEIKALMVNTSNVPITVNHKDRICQAELVSVVAHSFKETLNKPKQRTDRVGGLGSTGIETI